MNIFYLFGGLLLLICVAGVVGSAGVLLFGCLTKKGRHHSSDFTQRAANAVAAFESTTMTWNPKTGLVQYVWKAVD